MTTSALRKPSIWLACLPIVLTFVVLGVQLFHFGNFTPISHSPLAWLLPRLSAGFVATPGTIWKKASCTWCAWGCSP